MSSDVMNVFAAVHAVAAKPMSRRGRYKRSRSKVLGNFGDVITAVAVVAACPILHPRRNNYVQ